MSKTLYQALAEECNQHLQKALPIAVLTEDELLEIQEIILRQSGLFECCRRIVKNGAGSLIVNHKSFTAIDYAVSTGLLDAPIPEEILSRSFNHYNGIGQMKTLSSIELDSDLWTLTQDGNGVFNLYYLECDDEKLRS